MSHLDENELSEPQRAAQEKLHDLLQEHNAELGPWDDEDDNVHPAPNRFISQWVLMAAWVDGDGETWVTRITSRKLPGHSRDGLLHQGLYDL